MKEIILSEKDVLEYVIKKIDEFRCGYRYIDKNLYHHNTSYKDASSICKYGILTVKDLAKLQIKNYSKESLDDFINDDFHVNGIDSVSLSVVGLNDLYKDEYEYDPYSSYLVDFLISNDIKTNRYTINYGNEFLFYGNIMQDKFKSIDTRLLKFIKEADKKNYMGNYSINNVVIKYNELLKIASTVKDLNLDILLRDMSFEDDSILDINKMVCERKILLK